MRCRGRARAAIGMALCLSLADPLAPAVITVQGGCSLVEAILAANNDSSQGGCPAGSGDDTIVLTNNVTLNAVQVVDEGNNGLPTVDTTITLDGRGHTIERDPSSFSDFRMLKVADTGVFVLKNTTVSGGHAADGGAFFNTGGVLEIHASTLVDNFAELRGGAIYNGDGDSQLLVHDSVLSSNSVNTPGATVRGGAIYNYGSLQVTNSTFEANLAGGLLSFPSNAAGGAISSSSDNHLVITGSTFSGNNVVSTGSNIGSAISIGSFANLALSNSTVSNNGALSLAAAAVDVYSADLTHVTLAGNNNAALSGVYFFADRTLLADTDGVNCEASLMMTSINSAADDDTCETIPDTLFGLDLTLADNGGLTKTHALLPGSNAIDAGGLCDTPTDQRGAPRVGTCDVGAYEFMGCPRLQLEHLTIDSEVTYEECAITAGSNFAVVGPGGDLTLRFGSSAVLENGFSVGSDARLTLERDPSLQLVAAELIEADRARRRALRR